MGENEGAAAGEGESKLTQLEAISSQLAHLKSALETFSGSLEGDEDYASGIDTMSDHLADAETALNEALEDLRNATPESAGEASETGSSEETA